MVTLSVWSTVKWNVLTVILCGYASLSVTILSLTLPNDLPPSRFLISEYRVLNNTHLNDNAMFFVRVLTCHLVAFVTAVHRNLWEHLFARAECTGRYMAMLLSMFVCIRVGPRACDPTQTYRNTWDKIAVAAISLAAIPESLAALLVVNT